MPCYSHLQRVPYEHIIRVQINELKIHHGVSETAVPAAAAVI